MTKELIEQLTKEQNLRRYAGVLNEYIVTPEELEAFAKAYQAQSEQQEAVAFMDEDGEIYALPEQKLLNISIDDLIKSIGKNGVRLYTSPPKQIPDGLKEFAEDVKGLCNDFSSRTGNVYIKDVQASIDALLELHTSPTNTEVGE